MLKSMLYMCTIVHRVIQCKIYYFVDTTYFFVFQNILYKSIKSMLWYIFIQPYSIKGYLLPHYLKKLQDNCKIQRRTKRSCSKINYSHACLGIILAAPPPLAHSLLDPRRQKKSLSRQVIDITISYGKSVFVSVSYRSFPVGEQVMSMCDSSKECVLSSCSSRFHQIVNRSSGQVRLLRLEKEKNDKWQKRAAQIVVLLSWLWKGGKSCIALLILKERKWRELLKINLQQSWPFNILLLSAC